jgi:hypothetical protein
MLATGTATDASGGRMMNISKRTLGFGTGSMLLALIAVIGGSPVAAAGDSAAPACTASDLTARQTGSGAGMSQPYSLITLTNTSATACSLNGYPTIASLSTRTGRKPIKVTRGSLGNMTDPGPRRFVLAPGRHAWFAIGAATAYDPPLVTFRRAAFAVSPGADTVAARMSLQATAPTGKAFPIGVTAFAPGSGPSA